MSRLKPLECVNCGASLELDSVVAMEPEMRTVEIGGQLYRMVQIHPFTPEGGGGGIMYPLGKGGKGGCQC